MKELDLEKRFYDFALSIVKLVNKLPKTTAGIELGRQLLRSGTSIAANYAEAKGAFSKSDFTYKMSVCFKEARETLLWLNLLRDAELINDNSSKVLIEECKEIRNILGKSVQTSKRRKEAVDNE